MLYRVGRKVLSGNPHLMVGVLGAVAKLVPQGIRYGREFRKTRRFLQKSQWWSAEQHAEYQLGKLKDAGVYVSIRGNAIRVAPHLYNSNDDFEKLLDCLID